MGNYTITGEDGASYQISGVDSWDEAISALEMAGGDEQVEQQTNRVSRVGRDLMAGATLGWGDELEAGVYSAVDELKELTGQGEPKSVGDRYRQHKKNIRQQMDLHSQESPISSMAAQVAGSIVPAAAAVAAAPATGIASLAGLGAVEGGIAGYGQNRDPDALKNDVLWGAGVGGGIGAAAKPIMAGAAHLVQNTPLRGMINSADDVINAGLDKAGKAKDAFFDTLMPGRSGMPPMVRAPRPQMIPPRNALPDEMMRNVPDELRPVVGTADRLGLQLTPYQRTQDRALGQREAVLRSRTGGGDPFDDMAENNRDVFSTAAARSVGQSGNRVNLKEADEHVAKLFKQATKGGEKLRLKQSDGTRAGVILDKYTMGLGRRPKKIENLREDIDELVSKGTMTPREYQDFHSKLGQDARKAARAGDGGLMNAYKGLQNLLDRVVDRQDPRTLKKLRAARETYRNLVPLRARNVIDDSTGAVSMPQLRTQFQKDDYGYTRGHKKSDLYDLSRVFRTLGKDVVGDSGTATRSQGFMDNNMMPNSAISKAYLGTHPGGRFYSTLDTAKGARAIVPPLLAAPQDPNQERRR